MYKKGSLSAIINTAFFSVHVQCTGNFELKSCSEPKVQPPLQLMPNFLFKLQMSVCTGKEVRMLHCHHTKHNATLLFGLFLVFSLCQPHHHFTWV